MLLIVLLCALFSLPLSAREKEAYVVQQRNTLTFYYGDKPRSRSGNIWGVDEKKYTNRDIPAWTGTYSYPNRVVTKVVFDASFKDFRPTTTELWFYKLIELTTIEGLEYFNTSAVTNMSQMFSGCSSLKELNLSNFNTSSVTDMSRMFSDCSGLTALNLSNFNTAAVTNMSKMFSGCSGLTALNLSKFNTAAVTNMSDMFSGCSGLTALNLSKFNTAAVTNMSDMFHRCTLLEELNVSNFNTSAVTNMSDMFSGCIHLTALNLSNFNTAAVTNMSSMFSNCISLKTILNTNTWRCDYSRDMFYHCTQLRGAVKYDESKLGVEMANPETGYFKNPNKEYLEAYVVLSEDQQTLTFFYDANSILRSEKIWFIDENSSSSEPAWARFNTVIKKAVFDASFKHFIPTTTKHWFYFLSALTTIEGLENLNTAAVTDMSGMFSYCSSLKELNVSSFNTSAVKDMSDMFYGCSSLKELNVSSFNTSAVKDMREMFSGCSSLKTIFNSNTWRCEKSENMFKGCTQLKGIVSYDVDKLDVKMANPKRGYFYDPNPNAYIVQSKDQQTLTFFYDTNRTLRSGKIWYIDEYSGSSEPDWARFNTVIKKAVFDASFKDFRPTNTKYWFYNLKNLTTIEGLENLNTSAVTNMSGMFSGCSRLEELNVSHFNTSAVTDMGDMFSGCSSLKTLFNTNTWRCENSKNMFEGCTQLRGAVKYDESKLGVEMANPEAGYFRNPNKEYLEAYVVLSEDLQTFTFFYDVNRTLRSGKIWYTDELGDYSRPAWAGSNMEVMKVVFDASFKDFRPTTTEYWFYNLKALTTIEGLENLNTSSVTDMSRMFSGCSGLKELNVSHFNTSAVKDMREMFSGCSGLKELNVSNFNTSAVTDVREMFSGCSGLKTIYSANTWRCENSRYMFYGCTQLRGAVSYKYNKLDVEMANPEKGYFKNPNKENLEAYVQQSEDQQTLTFYYDANSIWRSGKIWYIDEISNSSRPSWKENQVVTKAVFDVSFKNFRPTTTYSWFYNLEALTTIEGLENLNTSAVTNMREMFSGCSGLKELNVSNFNTSSVTDMREMFSGCSGLKELNVSNFNTSSVTDMREMFRDCSSLKTIFNTNTWRCENSRYMFYGCTQLRGAVSYEYNKLDVEMANPQTGYFRNPNKENLEAYVVLSEDQQTLTFFYDTNSTLRNGKIWGINEKTSSSRPSWLKKQGSKKVVFDTSFKDFRPTTTEGWFYNLSALTAIEGLENLNTSAVTNMREMFSGCSGLKELNVSSLNTSSVKDMSGMFSGCSGLKELNVFNFNTSAVTNMSRMFKNCSGLKELYVFNFNTSAVTNMSEMFSGCSSLKELNVSHFNTSAVTDMSSMFSGGSSLKELNVSHFNTSAVTDMSSMFSGGSGLTSLNLSSLNTSAVTNMSRMFKNCSGLNELNVSNFNTSTVTDMSEMFYYCSGLTSLNVSNFNTSAVTNMSEMFSGCSGLKELNLSNFNTAAVTNMNRMFSGGSGLKELNLSNFNTSAVMDMSWMFWGCSGLKELNLSNFNTSAVTNMNRMFWDCSGLKELNVSNFNTSTVTDMSEMFWGCSGLKELNLSNFNTSAVMDMNWMFSGCSSLETIYSTNTWRCKNSRYMFEYCYRLRGAVKYDNSKLDVEMANPETGYFRNPNKEYLEAYVVLSEDQQTLTFFYDANSKSRSEKTWYTDEESSSSEPAWVENKGVIKVVFDASFRDFIPTTTKHWFYFLSALTTIEGLENLNTAAVTDMSGMFYGCASLKELNLSKFNTSAVKDMSQMFSGCSSLKTILNTNTWRCENALDMFNGCTQLRGAVPYDANKLEVNMANPITGYFTDSNLQAYVQLSEDQQTLTFYYDNNRKSRSGKIWYTDELTEFLRPAWTGAETSPNQTIKKVVFDVSFKNFRPITTYSWFYNLEALTTIEGIENLNTSAVNFMDYMFSGCSSLQELNLSNFNTSLVTNMKGMFSGCSSLKTIYNSDTWKCFYSQDMFNGCTQLQGAVKYDASKLDVTMANPTTGYFSGKLPNAIGRVIYDGDNATQIYNLQGKRVNGNQRHLPAGFYIVNGKKIYLDVKP